MTIENDSITEIARILTARQGEGAMSEIERCLMALRLEADAGVVDDVARIVRAEAATARAEGFREGARLMRTIRSYEYGAGPCWCGDLIPGRHSDECRANRARIAPAPVEPRGDDDPVLFTLRAVEWTGRPPGAERGYCPSCFRHRDQGHLDDCALAVTLKEKGKLTP